MSDVQSTLAERGARYGDFTDHAAIAQALQDTMRGFTIDKIQPDGLTVESRTPWNELSPVARQALTVIADKIARILSGDPNYADNWHDIQGYARLVEDRLPACDASFDEVMSFGGDPRTAFLGTQAAPVFMVNPAPLVVPPWPEDERIKFMAQDADGQWYGYTSEPSCGGHAVWSVTKTGKVRLTIGDPVPNPNWRNTLQERPKC